MKNNTMPYSLYASLARRMGEKAISQRLRMQVELAASWFGRGYGHVHLENLDAFARFVDLTLRLSGMREWGKRNSLDFKIEENEFFIPHLPQRLDGFKILHLTDIHIDGFIDDGKALFKMVAPLNCDLCVLTGDFRLLTHDNHRQASIGMSRLVSQINATHGIFGILGNHDFLEQVPALEESGVKVLLNEGQSIRHNDSELYIAGVDDPHFYGTHDLGRAYRARLREMPSILLAHSPELYSEATDYNTDLYLCGHTHGGQICLPGGTPLVTHANCPRYMTSGKWKHMNMHGYTSRGTGCSGVQARFNCPPEISIHTLRKVGGGS